MAKNQLSASVETERSVKKLKQTKNLKRIQKLLDDPKLVELYLDTERKLINRSITLKDSKRNSKILNTPRQEKMKFVITNGAKKDHLKVKIK
jgi:hypothetical protein